jgi:hypothetical protein
MPIPGWLAVLVAGLVVYVRQFGSWRRACRTAARLKP